MPEIVRVRARSRTSSDAPVEMSSSASAFICARARTRPWTHERRRRRRWPSGVGHSMSAFRRQRPVVGLSVDLSAMTLLPFCDENGRDLPCGLRSYSGEPWRGIFVLVPSLIMTNVRSHSQLPYFNHTRYLLLKCDFFHIENVLRALFVSIFLCSLFE